MPGGGCKLRFQAFPHRRISRFGRTSRGAVSVFLAASLLHLLAAQSYAGPREETGHRAGAAASLSGTPSISKVWELYFDSAVENASREEGRAKAVELFGKAIELDPARATERSVSLQGKAKAAYLLALWEAKKAGEGKKEKKSHTLTYILGAALVVGAAAAAYALLSKKNTLQPPPEPVDVTISLDVYNHTKGLQKELASRTVKSGSEVKITIAETGVTGIDPKYIAIYSKDFKTRISIGSDGNAEFIAPQSNVKYHVILFNALGTNSLGQQVSYDWVSSVRLWNSKRNHKVFRKDFNGQTGPEKVWGGEYIPLIKANGVFDQLNSALNVGYTTWGYVDRQPTATTGDFSYGFGDCLGHDGYNAGSWIAVNPTTLYKRVQAMVQIGLAGAFENLLQVGNVGGEGSSFTVCQYRVLVQNGNGTEK